MPLKTKLCKFYDKGQCVHGHACSFAHGPHEMIAQPVNPASWGQHFNNLAMEEVEPGMPKQKQPSRFSTENSTAKFAYLRRLDMVALQAQAMENMQQQMNFMSERGLARMPVKSKLCHFHERGQCRNGSQCQFAHGKQEIKPAIHELALTPSLANDRLHLGRSPSLADDLRQLGLSPSMANDRLLTLSPSLGNDRIQSSPSSTSRYHSVGSEPSSGFNSLCNSLAQTPVTPAYRKLDTNALYLRFLQRQLAEKQSEGFEADVFGLEKDSKQELEPLRKSVHSPLAEETRASSMLPEMSASQPGEPDPVELELERVRWQSRDPNKSQVAIESNFEARPVPQVGEGEVSGGVQAKLPYPTSTLSEKVWLLQQLQIHQEKVQKFEMLKQAQISKSPKPKLIRASKLKKVNTKECRFYVFGTCKNGSSCTFLHSNLSNVEDRIMMANRREMFGAPNARNDPQITSKAKYQSMSRASILEPEFLSPLLHQRNLSDLSVEVDQRNQARLLSDSNLPRQAHHMFASGIWGPAGLRSEATERGGVPGVDEF